MDNQQPNVQTIQPTPSSNESMEKWPIWTKLLISLSVFAIFILVAVVLLIDPTHLLRRTSVDNNPNNFNALLSPALSQYVTPTQTESVFSRANNIKRRSDINAIVNATNQYIFDNPTKPLSLPTTPIELGNQQGQIDLCTILLPKYLPNLPIDPSLSDGAIQDNSCNKPYHLGYRIRQNSGKIEVSAPLAENGEIISVIR